MHYYDNLPLPIPTPQVRYCAGGKLATNCKDEKDTLRLLHIKGTDFNRQYSVIPRPDNRRPLGEGPDTAQKEAAIRE